MIDLRSLQHNSLKVQGLLFSLLLLMATPALADNGRSTYNPKNPSRPSTATGSGSTRGCTPSASTFLTALAPESHVGKTISTHPTLFWYVPERESYSIEFNLYELHDTGTTQLIKRVTLNSAPGVMSYTLPQNEPGLVAGRQYLWQVQLECAADRPSSNSVVEVVFEVVPLSSDLRTAIANTRDPLQQAERLAAAGIWYDALVAALADRSNAYWLQLLNDLAQLEPAETPATVGQRDRLQRLITFEQQSR